MTLVESSQITPAIRKWKPYPICKDSGVEWLGKIPEHWEIKRLKFAAKVNMGQSPSSEEYNVVGDGMPFLQGNAEFGIVHPEPKLYCPTARKRTLPGEILLSVRAPVGALNFADQEYGIGRGLCAISPNGDGLANKFARYLLEVVRLELNIVATGSTYEAVSGDEVRSLRCVLPPPREQHTIADFLDHETAKIDALVTKKERLVELLQEKRSAIISHAVTKGLDPNVPMKDPGIEWLGQIPAHWEVWTVRNLIRKTLLVIQDGNHGELHPTAEDYVSEGIPFLMANDVREQSINLTSCKFIPKELADSLRIGFSRPSDVLLTHKGTIGETALVPDKLNFPYLMLTPQVTYYRSKSTRLLPRYLCYLFQSRLFKEQLTALSLQQSTRDYVGITAQKNLLLVLPEPSEQGRLVENLDREIAKIDTLIAKVREGIEKLKEYRTALISAAVTGKIDVRDGAASTVR